MPSSLLGQAWRPDGWGPASLILAGVLGLVALVAVAVFARYFGLWIQSKATHADVGLWRLIGMTLRRVDPAMILRCKIMALQSGLTAQDGLTTRGLEAHDLAGGNVPVVVRAMIAAHRADIPLSLKRAMAIDLAGRNVLAAVQTSVTPRVIDCPDPAEGRQTVDGVAKDGIQLRVKARVTVRTNIDRLVGGATEETIIARVGEGIVTTIGSAASYKTVLADPASITERILEKGLDAGTAFEILSIDIADIDVGENIGANLQSSQAQADMRVAQAKAEVRRAYAVAREQEMRAAVQQGRAKVVLAESSIPRGIADAFREGNIATRAGHRRRLSATPRTGSPAVRSGGR
jgi:uncharacterized protein YqfA (UPF0365 family)